MHALTLTPTLRRSLLALALSACASLASAADVLHVELDTSSFSSTGWIDLQFNPGGPTAAAYADLSNFVGFDATQAPSTSGDVSGSLATGFHIGNTSPDGYNDLFHAVNLGGKVSFDVSFSGALGTAAAQRFSSTLGVGLYGADQVTSLGNANGAGQLLALTWTPSITAGVSGTLSRVIADSSIASVTAVPEPSSWLMLGSGLALLALLARRKNSATQPADQPAALLAA